MPNGLLWQYVIDQQGRAFHHASCSTAWAKASALAAEGDQTILVARGTLDMIDGLGKSVIKEANLSDASKAVVVDTLDLTEDQISGLKSQIIKGVKSKKKIVVLE